MSDERLFKNTDEQEKVLAPQDVPGAAQERVRADEGTTTQGDAAEPPAAAPVANLGSSLSGQAAPPGVRAERDDLLRTDVGSFGSDPDDDQSRQ